MFHIWNNSNNYKKKYYDSCNSITEAQKDWKKTQKQYLNVNETELWKSKYIQFQKMTMKGKRG